MAILIPDTCPSKATAGERRVYDFLREALPSRYMAWYEPVVAGRYPDFTLLGEDFGLLMLEVKGWYAGQITRADDHEIELRREYGGEVRVETHKHPIRQVRDYLFALNDEIGRPEYAILRHDAGEYRGKPRFPGGFGVIFTNITRPQLDAAGLTPVFPADRVICRDELSALETAGTKAVLQRLRGLFAVRFPFEPLTKDQIKTLKGVLHREVIVRKRPATKASVAEDQPLLPGAVALDVLDIEQEQVARSLGDGHHVLFGIAGSGKTVLLLARARMLAERDAAAKILILCYNKALAGALAAPFAEEPELRNVEVRHFHSWAARKTGLRKRDDESFEAFEGRMVAVLLGGIEHFAESEKYDAILIDEAHDFDPDWFRCATGLLKGGEQGDLLIAVDGAQSLYERGGSFTWKSVGVRASGRTRRLSRNYRNTKQILEFAWQVAQSPVVAEESETHVRVLPTKASRHGLPPRYRGAETIAQEHEIIARIVADLRALGLADRDIAVLYPRREGNRIDRLCRRLREGGEVCWVSNESDRDGGVRSLQKPGLRLLTIHAAKGLEFPAVIVTALDQLPGPFEPDVVRDANLLYVGLTRAMDHLIVTWTGRSEFTDRVSRSTKAEPLPD